MPDLGSLLADSAVIIASVVGGVVVNRRSKKAAAETRFESTSAARIQAEADSQAKFRTDILNRLTELENKLERSQAQLESQRVDAQARFEAREDQLIAWGTWVTEAPPRRAPAFVWPPTPGGV